MKKIRFAVLIAAVVSVVSIARAGTITENFTNNPLQEGWLIFGDTNLFQWDSVNHDLAVTWDSSQSNSYFYRPLNNVLTPDDDFQFSFDLTISNIAAGVNPDKPDAIEVGVGFLNFEDATSTNFVRGVDPVNLAEFDYFPLFVDPDFGLINASVSPVIISTNGNFYGAFGSFITLTNDVAYTIQNDYTAATGMLVTTVMLAGSSNVLITAVTSPAVPDSDGFRVDTFCISSYSDMGDDFDSLYGQGTIANVSFTIPPPPVQNLAIGNSNGVWQVQFTSRSNWLYTLQSAPDLQTWQNVSAPAAGNGTALTLQDTNPPADHAFYRVSAARP
jgi:hypothetical protein